MDEQILNQVSSFLFEEVPGQDFFKSLYNTKPYGDYKGRAKELLDLSIEQVPKYCYQNTAFSYSMTTKLLPKFEEYIAWEEEQEKPAKDRDNSVKKPTQSPEKALSQALNQTMQQMGIQENIDGQKHQDELMGEIEQEGEQQIWGIMATKDPNAQAISEIIKRVDASSKTVQKSLKNISAIADSLIKGIEKIKSDYSGFDFDYGRNLQQIDPSELAYLQGDARQLFLLKYAKGELLEESSQDKKGLGDLVLAVDTSGSTCTSATQGLNILDLEMGIALTIAKIATKHKCKVRLCLHTTKIHGDSDWIKGKDAINRYFADIYVKNKCVASGDNDFNKVLGGLCQWMEDKQYPTKRKPGIVFITDGHDRVDQYTIDRVKCLQQKQGIKLFSYFVSTSDPRNHAKDLISISHVNYWIDAKKPIDKQIDAFIEVLR